MKQILKNWTTLSTVVALFATSLIILGCANAKQKTIELPFEYDSNGMFIKMAVNGNKPATFLFDTGSEITAINSEYAKKIKLKFDSYNLVAGVTGQEKYGSSKGNKVTLAQGCELKDITFTEMSFSHSTNEDEMQGIIGADILKNNIVDIDFDKKVIKLHPFASLPDTKSYKELSFTHTGDYFPRVQTTIILPNGEKHSGLTFLDSGGQFAFLMNSNFAKENNIVSKVGKYLQRESYSVNGVDYNYIARVNGFDIADFHIPTFPMDISMSKNGVISEKGSMGMAGIELMKKFNTIIDAKTNKLYLKANENFNKMPWFPTNGLVLEEQNGKCFIKYVIDPQDKEFVVGDQALEVNDQPITSASTFNELMMNLKEGDVYKIKIKDKKGNLKMQTFKVRYTL